MTRLILALVAVAAGCGLAACTETTLDPAYPMASLVWDEGLLGEWREDGNDADRYIVTRRKMAFEGDRLDPHRDVDGGLFLGSKPTDAELVDVYTITAHMGDEDIRGPIIFNAYVFKAGGARFLSIQPTLSQLARAGLALPIHMVQKLERDADRVTLSQSEVGIFWMPNLRSMDAPREVDPNPIDLDELLELLEQAKGSDSLAFAYTSSIDRLIQFYGRYAEDERLWESDNAHEFVRVGDAIAEPEEDE